MKKLWKIFAPVLLFLTAPSLALAAVGSTGKFDEGLRKISDLFPSYGFSDQTPAGLIVSIITILLFLSGLVSVLYLIIGGYWYITSAGNEETAEKGKKTLINAIIGLIIVLMSYVIVSVIYNLLTEGVV